MLGTLPPAPSLTCQFPDPVVKEIQLVAETQFPMIKDTMESKNLGSRFSVVHQSSALNKIWIPVLRGLRVIVCSCLSAHMQYANSDVDAAFPGHEMGYSLTTNVLSREHINQATDCDAMIGQQNVPYPTINKLSETLEETKISIQDRTGVEMPVGYPEGSHVTAPSLVSESQSRVLGTGILRTRSDASSSAAGPRILMGNAPGNLTNQKVSSVLLCLIFANIFKPLVMPGIQKKPKWTATATATLIIHGG